MQTEDPHPETPQVSKESLQEEKDSSPATDASFIQSQDGKTVFLDRRTERRIQRGFVLTERGPRSIWKPAGTSSQRNERVPRRAAARGGAGPPDTTPQLATVRVLVLGANHVAQRLAELLSSHSRVCGCYFVSETTDEAAIESMKKYAYALPLRSALNDDEVVRVAEWVLADYVFLVPTGETHDDGVSLKDKERLERTLAQNRVTFMDENLTGLLLENPSLIDALFRARDSLEA
jgi:hypothetical protein